MHYSTNINMYYIRLLFFGFKLISPSQTKYGAIHFLLNIIQSIIHFEHRSLPNQDTFTKVPKITFVAQKVMIDLICPEIKDRRGRALTHKMCLYFLKGADTRYNKNFIMS